MEYYIIHYDTRLWGRKKRGGGETAPAVIISVYNQDGATRRSHVMTLDVRRSFFFCLDAGERQDTNQTELRSNALTPFFFLPQRKTGDFHDTRTIKKGNLVLSERLIIGFPIFFFFYRRLMFSAFSADGCIVTVEDLTQYVRGGLSTLH